MINRLNDKAVISHYPPSIEEYDADKVSTQVPRICRAFFNERGMISFEGAEHIETNNTLYKVPYVAAGLFFCKSKFLDELPYDPDLPYLFVGEEILQSIRFWTNGWDIYTPSENVVYHYYTRKEEPKIWTDKKYSDNEATIKVKEIIGILKSDKKHNYGIGKVRTLDEYYNFAGIDIDNNIISKDFCRSNLLPDKRKNNYSMIYIMILTIIITIIMIYITMQIPFFKKK
jgi:hypothetical protein